MYVIEGISDTTSKEDALKQVQHLLSVNVCLWRQRIVLVHSIYLKKQFVSTLCVFIELEQ